MSLTPGRLATFIKFVFGCDPKKDCTFIQSTYLDNKEFLSAEVVKKIEQLKNAD
jgi:phage terminase large subunit